MLVSVSGCSFPDAFCLLSSANWFTLSTASDFPCWPSTSDRFFVLPGVDGSVSAHRFPLPPRGNEKDLETSLAAIVRLTGIKYPVYIQGVTCLKGWLTLIYRVRASSDFGSIQWHLVESDSPEDKRIVPDRAHVRNVANWRDVGLDLIRKSRCFVGYCNKANIHIGTESFDPQSSENASGASLQKHK